MSDRSPLTVLHIFSGDLWAGAEVMIYHLLVELKTRGVKVIGLSLNEGILTSKLRDAGVETFVIPESQNHFAKILLQALYLLKGRKIDIIHSHRYKENLLALFIARCLSVKCLVTTLHGLFEASPHTRAPILSRLKERLNYFVATSYFTTIVAVSQEMKHRLMSTHPITSEKLCIIRNGVAPPATTHSRKGLTQASSFHVGTVGRLVPVKDFDLFLDVAERVQKQMANVRFSILGDGPLKERLTRRVREKNLEKAVKILPARSDPFPYYDSLDLFLNTSLHEGIPLSVLEAMSCGLPVVAPRVGGIPEIIENGRHGFLVDGRTPEDFAWQCLELLRNEDVRKKFGSSAAERFIDQFSSVRMAASYLKLYTERSRS
jgi:glycosyltransferase involved in cell wall biosynthesis